jgi:excisionase family DNA binding protein
MAPKMNRRNGKLVTLPKQSIRDEREPTKHDLRSVDFGRVSGRHVHNASAAVRTTDLAETDTIGATGTHQPAKAIEHPVFLTVMEAAALLRVSQVTLGRWRIEGRGPVYRKFGRRVLYADRDVIAWAAGQARMSTSDQR